MLGVTIHEYENGKDRIVGSIYLGADDQLHCYPADDTLLHSILTTPARGNKYNPKPILPGDDPQQFLDNLRYMYRSPYLRATAPVEINL